MLDNLGSVGEFDQILAEADRTPDLFVEQFRTLNGEHGEVANLAMLDESLAEMPSTALAPLLAAAIRRISHATKGATQ